MSDALVPADRIQVTVSRGVITLQGEVTWEFEKRVAEGAVRGLVGVRGVINNIRVRLAVGPSPEQLSQQIQAALVRNAETNAERITVEVPGRQDHTPRNGVLPVGKGRSGAGRLVRSRCDHSGEPHHGRSLIQACQGG